MLLLKNNSESIHFFSYHLHHPASDLHNSLCPTTYTTENWNTSPFHRVSSWFIPLMVSCRYHKENRIIWYLRRLGKNGKGACSLCGRQTSSISITQEVVRNASFLGPTLDQLNEQFGGWGLEICLNKPSRWFWWISRVFKYRLQSESDSTTSVTLSESCLKAHVLKMFMTVIHSGYLEKSVISGSWWTCSSVLY